MFRAFFPLAGLVLALAGCALGQKSAPPVAATPVSVVREQLIFHSDFPLPQEHPLLDELLALRTEVAAKLAIPAAEEPIHVYLFESQQTYRDFAARYFPANAERRAFFVETDTRLNVYAQWGDMVAEDLRHEVTHGYVHGSVRNVPLWLDEGIAEYFETPPSENGRHSRHIELLLAAEAGEEWSPDLARLEAILSAAEMTQLDYAEAWLWTHLLLESTPERRAALQAYLAALRRDGASGPLSLKLREIDSAPHRSLAEHLARFRQ